MLETANYFLFVATDLLVVDDDDGRRRRTKIISLRRDLIIVDDSFRTILFITLWKISRSLQAFVNQNTWCP